MLAQNFKTPADLGIADAEFEALMKVLGMLERGELKHAANPFAYQGHDGFHMSDFDYKDDDSVCGTVCCIAGWCDRIAATSLSVKCMQDKLPYELDTLFMGPAMTTPAQAAIALRNYLTFGEPRWDDALAG